MCKLQNEMQLQGLKFFNEKAGKNIVQPEPEPEPEPGRRNVSVFVNSRKKQKFDPPNAREVRDNNIRRMRG